MIVLVGELDGRRHLNIIGKGQSTSHGVRKGEIVDLKAAAGCTHAALIAAEKNAGANIEGVYLAASGSHLAGFANRGVTNVSASDGSIRNADVARASADAKSKALPADRVYVHHMRTGSLVDGRRVDNPLAMVGERLEMTYWHVHADERKIQNMIRVVNGFGLDVEDVIVSSIASGSIIASQEEKAAGVLVVDIGSGASDYVLYRNGCIQRSGVIAVGGDHFTNDLSIGLRINASNAENIKHRCGKAIVDKRDKQEQVLMYGDLRIGDRPIPRNAIYRILHARAEELFMILKNKLGSALNAQNLPGGVILTGGGSALHSLGEAARPVLGVEVRLGESPSWVRDIALRRPEYATVFGLLYYGLSAQQSDDDDAQDVAGGGLFQRVAKIFNVG